MLLGVQAISRRMLISDHDRSVVLIVTSAAAVVSLAVALVLSDGARAVVAPLREDVRRVGAGGPRSPGAAGRPSSRSSPPSSPPHANASPRRASASSGSRSRAASSSSWVSHDLRTPLAGIRVMAEALEDGIATDPARYHRQIRGEVDRMVVMVDDLFELSRIHAGQLVVQPQPIVLGDLVSEAIAAADPVARARGVHPRRRGPARPPGRRRPGRLSPRARPTSSSTASGTPPPTAPSTSAPGRSSGGVELAVTDGCGGIAPTAPATGSSTSATAAPAARTPEDPMQDVHTSRAGLGLAIVKGIVEAHHGRVAVENVGTTASPALGCRFRVLLPAR